MVSTEPLYGVMPDVQPIIARLTTTGVLLPAVLQTLAQAVALAE